MNETFIQVMRILRGSWRFRWHALAVAWVLSLLGWLFVYAMPDQYEARAKIYLDTQGMLAPLLDGLAVDTTVMSKVEMMTRALLSQPHLEKVAAVTGLDTRVQTSEDREKMVQNLRERISIRGEEESFFSIWYQDTDRQTALSVVDTLLSTFVADSIHAHKDDTELAQGFLEEQIHYYEERLTEAEQRLADFKKKHVGLMPGSDGDYYTRLQTLLAQLQETRERISVAKRRRNELARMIRGEEPVFGMVPSGTATGEGRSSDPRIAELEARLDELLLNYTDQHPDVIAIRETIERLEANRPAPEPGMLTADAVTLERNPVYQQMKIAFNQAELLVSTLEAEESEQARAVEELREMVNTIPEVEAKLARLNRDYQITKTQYEALVSRLETARLSERAEETSDNVKFRIIEPPYALNEPVSPNRPLLLVALLVGTLLSGGALAGVMNEARRSFVDTLEIKEEIGLPVLGTVSYAPAKGRLRRERAGRVLFYASVVVMVTGYVLVIVLAQPGSEAIRNLMAAT